MRVLGVLTKIFFDMCNGSKSLRKQPVRVKRRFKGAEIANGSLVHRGYVFIVFVIDAVRLRQHTQKPVRVTSVSNIIFQAALRVGAAVRREDPRRVGS